MKDENLQKALEALVGKCIRLEARCDALAAACEVVALKQGISQEKMAAAIERLTEYCHQKRLERIEDVDPAGAAAVDCRTITRDIFD